jgi:hypothetical protein
MVVKLNADQDGITHAYRWDNQTWVATTDLTGDTGPHGIGHYFASGQMAATQGNSVNNYRLATQNHIQVNGGNTYLSFPMPTVASGYAPGVYCTFLEAGDFTGTGVGNMALASGVPTNINTSAGSSWEVVANIAPTLISATLSNITKGGSTITMDSQPAMLKLRDGADYNFSFTYTRTSSNTLNLLRQPLLSDFTGFDNNYTVGGDSGTYVTGTTVHIADTTGIKVGMYVEDVNFSSGESTTNPLNRSTKVTSIQEDDSIVLSHTPISPGIPAGSSLRIYSDWKYELKSATAFGNKTGNTVITVSGIFKIKQYGSSAPDGNVVLQAGNFITNVTP